MKTIWRAGGTLLVADSETFALVDATGEVVKRFDRRRQFSIEDDLWTWEHLVEHARFFVRTTIEHYGVGAEIREDDIVVGLVPAGDEQSLALVDAAFAREAAARTAADHARELAARRGIDAIEGALDDHDLGEDLARAQAALIRRVRLYADEHAAALLRTLVSLARAQPAEPVIRAYARGCLLACYASGELPALPEEGSSVTTAIAGELAERARDLKAWADAQSDIDARLNAVALLQAAAAVALAAQLAGHRSN